MTPFALRVATITFLKHSVYSGKTNELITSSNWFESTEKHEVFAGVFASLLLVVIIAKAINGGALWAFTINVFEISSLLWHFTAIAS